MSVLLAFLLLYYNLSNNCLVFPTIPKSSHTVQCLLYLPICMRINPRSHQEVGHRVPRYLRNTKLKIFISNSRLISDLIGALRLCGQTSEYKLVPTTKPLVDAHMVPNQSLTSHTVFLIFCLLTCWSSQQLL